MDIFEGCLRLFCVIYLGLTGFNSITIDLTTVEVVQSYHKLCWKQLANHASLQLKINDSLKMPGIWDSNKNKHCIEVQNNDVNQVTFPVEESININNFTIVIRFSLELQDQPPIIRSRVGSKVVHLKLIRNQQDDRISAQIECAVVFRSSFTKVLFINSTYPYKAETLPLGSYYQFQYSCRFASANELSAKFKNGSGAMFPEEKYSLYPFIQFLSERFLVIQYNIPHDKPQSYSLVIYDVTNSQNICLKIFRLFKSSGTKIDPLIPQDCKTNYILEDLGTYDDDNRNMYYVILDMYNHLKIDHSYKLAILWNGDQNFIFFKLYRDQDCGLINLDILKGQYIRITDEGAYDAYRNMEPSLRQHGAESCMNSSVVLNETLLINTPNKEAAVLPAISKTSPSFEMITSINNPDKVRKSCPRSFYPFCFLMILDRINSKMDVLKIQKQEDNSSRIQNLTLVNSDNSNFAVSWEIKFYLVNVTPPLFLLKMEDEFYNCKKLYIIKCRTCNQHFKELSENQAAVRIKQFKATCQDIQTYEDHYEAADSSILFHTTQMPFDQIFFARVYSVNTAGLSADELSNPRIIKGAVKDSSDTVNCLIAFLVIFMISFIVVLGILIYEKRCLVTNDNKRTLGEITEAIKKCCSNCCKNGQKGENP